MNPYQKNPEDRVAVILDLRNVSTPLRTFAGGKWVCYDALLDYVLDGRRLATALVIDGVRPYADKADKDASFHSYLSSCGYTSIRVPASNGASKFECVDMEVVYRMTRFAADPRVDVIELISGDGDYYNVIRNIRLDYNKQVNVSSFRNNLAKAARKSAMAVTYLAEVPMISMSPHRSGEEMVPMTPVKEE